MSEMTMNARPAKTKTQEIWHRFLKNKGALLGLIVLIILILVALTVDIWLPQEKIVGQNIVNKLQGPSKEHWFGTDELGRDLFWRTIYGTKYSLAIGFVAVLVSAIIGVPLGAIAGYFGGKVESIIMRITDIFSAIPPILMAIAIVSVLGRTTFNLMLSVGVSHFSNFVRVTRAAVLTVKNEEYIE